MKDKFKEFLESDRHQMNIPMMPIKEIVKIASKYGFRGYDFKLLDSDGKFQMNFESINEEILLCGSLMTGNFGILKEIGTTGEVSI